MHDALLAILRCPFCGTRLVPIENDALARHDGRLVSGVLGCECCAFPVVDGIPVLTADAPSRAALVALESGRRDDARDLLLGLDGARAAAFRALHRPGRAPTYRELIGVLSPDAEGTYFVYRLSDPTFVMAEGVLRALGQEPRTTARWVIDVCGGSGHLTRVLTGLPQGSGTLRPGTVLADVYFWKLWLAARITAPACHPVCCDANQPLPFDSDRFSMAVLSDAFPYIWHKRLLASELMRLTGPDGVVVMPHLHSANGENMSAGMPLTPPAYADLFTPLAPRLFRDADLLTSLLDHDALDLARPVAPPDLGAEPSLTLVASRDPGLFRHYHVPPDPRLTGALIVNPLYRVERHPGGSRLELHFPTPEYAEEFGSCRRYLPETLDVAADLTGVLNPAAAAAALGERLLALRRARVLLDAPRHYC